jgi:hypothetical protein
MVIAAKAWLSAGSTLQCSRAISLWSIAIGLRWRADRTFPDRTGNASERSR